MNQNDLRPERVHMRLIQAAAAALIALPPLATPAFAFGQQQPSDEETRRLLEEWRKVPHELAQKYYPSVFTSLTLPDGFTLLFILKDKETVLKHDAMALHEPEGTPVPRILERVFPDVSVPPNASHGAQCFAPISGKHAKFCVAYAVVP